MILEKTLTGTEKPVRIDRIVSVILNGIPMQKLAVQNDHNVDAMAATLLQNLSPVMQNNIQSDEVSLVSTCLKQEIVRRIDLAQAI